MVKATCKVCGRLFYVSPAHKARGDGTFCSRACKSADNTQIRVCQYCGVSFISKNSTINYGRAKYCSKVCFDASQRGTTRPEFTPEHRSNMSKARQGARATPETRANLSNARKKYCSEHPETARKGDKCNFWIDGNYPIKKAVRGLTKAIAWRDAVFARDNYTCQCTGQKGGYLEAHHIIPLSALMKEYKIKTLDDAEKCDALWDIRNGITLSKEAHRALHRSKK